MSLASLEELHRLLDAGPHVYLSTCDRLSETDWTLTGHNVTSLIQSATVGVEGVGLLPLARFLRGT